MDVEAINQKAQTSNPSMTSQPRTTGAVLLPKPEDVAKALGVEEITIDWLAGDGSDRCYFRLKSPQNEKTYVLMQLSKADAKLIENNGYEWIQIGELLSQNRIFVPKTIATLPEHAALIIEDYGNVMLENVVTRLQKEGNEKSIDGFYDKASSIVFDFYAIQQDKLSPWCQRQFDFERFSWELDFFYKEYIEKAFDLNLNERQKKLYKQESKDLSHYLASLDQVFVHRDFHSRNLMCKDTCIAVIDFQDARLGPAAYDLVSLYFDSYVNLSDQQRLSYIRKAVTELEKRNLNHLAMQVKESWPATLLQRQLKALGSFAYLTIEKKRGDYLKYAPAALDTLKTAEIFDQRWPFLSKELIGLLSDRLSKG